MLSVRPIEVNERARLQALLYEYLTELKALVDGDWDPTAYPWLDAQWSDPSRRPFFILVDEQPVGLALVRGREEDGAQTHEIAEFYLAPRHRRNGLATQAITQLCHRFPGRWTLTTHVANETAVSFWTRVTSKLAHSEPTIQAFGDPEDPRLRFEFVLA